MPELAVGPRSHGALRRFGPENGLERSPEWKAIGARRRKSVRRIFDWRPQPDLSAKPCEVTDSHRRAQSRWYPTPAHASPHVEGAGAAPFLKTWESRPCDHMNCQ